MSTPPALPRSSLALVCTLFAGVFGWAAMVLPWQQWTMFAVTTAAMALVHGATAVTAWLGRPSRALLWRIQSVVALTYLAYLTWNLLTSATYIATLYGGLGRGVAVALFLVWLIAAAITVPLSAWGLSVTGGIRRGPWQKGSAAVGLLVLAWAIVDARLAAAATPVLPDEPDLRAKVRAALDPVFTDFADATAWHSEPLAFDAPVVCPEPPSPRAVSIGVTHVAPGVAQRPEPRTHCVQAEDVDAALRSLSQWLEAEALPGPVKIDIVTAVAPLEHVVPVVDALTLRPGLDGVCEGGRCLMPWQMLAADAFTAVRPIPVVPELRFGFDAVELRKVLAEPGRRGAIPAGVEGLSRIETASYVTTREGDLLPLRRMHSPGPELSSGSVQWAVEAAEAYILGALGPDGRFEYRVEPFEGRVSYSGFSLARQAGTTLVVCELARDEERAREVATRALEMLARTQRVHGDMAGLSYPMQEPVERLPLGPTALAAIAFASCRDLVGTRFDEDLARLDRFLLAMQREDGSFHPAFDLKTGQPIPGPDPLYAVGQAVYALTLLESITASETEVDFPEHDEVRRAVEAAMNYTATEYWNVFAADFFFMEENWHCLAARASLGHHRNDGYERFCLDYVRYKQRLILDEEARVDPDLVGGYGFGNVLMPHDTGSAGFGEASSAALAIAAARGEDVPEVEAALRDALGFLLHHQWRPADCFACVSPRAPTGEVSHPIVGGFSEHPGSPHIRIDYVQHAMAALGHGGRVLGLIDGARDDARG